jgi:hypothetical protein
MNDDYDDPLFDDDDDLPPPPRLGALPESLLAWKNGWTEMDETTQAFF